MAAPLIDTNVFIHAQTTDHRSEECRRLVRAVQNGDVTAHLDPLVLHELTYALPRYAKQMSRDDIARYLNSVLTWQGIEGDTDLMIDAVERWQLTPGLGFVDAVLAARAAREDRTVFTLNVREFEGQGAQVPQPLPDGTE